MTYALDASALLRFLLGQGGSARVLEVLEQARAKQARVTIAAVNWGEVTGKLHRLHDVDSTKLRDTFQHHGLEICDSTAERAEAAALLKNRLRIGYADAFCIQLALTIEDHLLVTADFDFKFAEGLVTLEFLPAHRSA